MSELKNKLKDLRKILSTIKKRAKMNKKQVAFVLLTTKQKGSDFVILPSRRTSYVVCGVVAVYEMSAIRKIIKELDGNVDYILVDAEQKLSSMKNLLSTVLKLVKKSEVLTFKSNDSTADATDAIISYLMRYPIYKKIAIVGAGNIGCKVALKLVERGHEVFIASSKLPSAKKKANALNEIKPNETKSKVFAKSITKVATDCDVIIGFTPKIPVINSKMILQMKSNGLIIDGGLGTLYEEAIKIAKKKKINIIRVDVRPGFIASLALVFETKKFFENYYGSIKMKNFNIISGGIYGELGDIVVDSVKNPTQLIGISDGKGGIIEKKRSKEFMKKIDLVNEWISKQIN